MRAANHPQKAFSDFPERIVKRDGEVTVLVRIETGNVLGAIDDLHRLVDVTQSRTLE